MTVEVLDKTDLVVFWPHYKFFKLNFTIVTFWSWIQSKNIKLKSKVTRLRIFGFFFPHYIFWKKKSTEKTSLPESSTFSRVSFFFLPDQRAMHTVVCTSTTHSRVCTRVSYRRVERTSFHVYLGLDTTFFFFFLFFTLISRKKDFF